MRSYLAIRRSLSERWTAVEFRRASKLVESPRGTRQLPLLSLSSDGVVTERGADARQRPTDEYSERYWKVTPGQLVVNPMWLIGGGIGVSFIHGAVSPDYRVYKVDEVMYPRYVHHLLRSVPYRDQYRLLVRAETTFDRRITKDDFGGIPVPVPPLRTQRAIADYLDRETVRIDALIAAKQRMVELLEERLRSFIAILYTDLCASYGSVAISRLCAVAVDCVNKTAPLSDEPTDFQMLRTTNVKGGIVDYEDCSFVTAETYRRWNRRATPVPGDVLLTRQAPVGEVGLIAEDERVILGQQLMLFRADARLAQPQYLLTMFQAPQVRSIMDRFGLGAAHPHLKVGQCLSIPIPNAPPTAQQGALDRLGAVSEGDASMKLALTTQVTLLQERRQALVTAAVTGQLDIPGAA